MPDDSLTDRISKLRQTHQRPPGWPFPLRHSNQAPAKLVPPTELYEQAPEPTSQSINQNTGQLPEERKTVV